MQQLKYNKWAKSPDPQEKEISWRTQKNFNQEGKSRITEAVACAYSHDSKI